MNQIRVEKVMHNLAQKGLSQLFVCDPLAIKWLSGYYTLPLERFLGLLLTDKNEPVMFCNRLFPDPGAACDNVVWFDDTDNPIEIVAQHCQHDRPLGVDRTLEARWLLPLMNSGAASDYVLASSVVDQARSIKDEAELAALRKSSHINDLAMDWLKNQIQPGVTEMSIAERLLATYRELGADGYSFDPIVAFGANAADPHHETDNTLLEEGQVVLFDIGCVVDDYCSDMTRSFWFAGEKGIEPDELTREAYETVRRAQAAAEKLVKPGVLFSEIDACARDIIAEKGFGQYFTHRLGHQIGLECHEPGDVSGAHHEPVQVGQVFSIEPGIYIPGKVGVRIEDLVIVTPDGCEVINSYPKEFTAVR